MKAGDPKSDGLAELISSIVVTFVSSYCFIRFGFGQVHWNFTIIDIHIIEIICWNGMHGQIAFSTFTAANFELPNQSGRAVGPIK